MSVLNTTVPLIETYNDVEVKHFPLRKPTSGLSMLHDYAKTNDIWYCFITTVTSLKYVSIVDLMGPDVLSKVINKQASIVVDLSFEPFLDCIDSIYEDLVLPHNIPASQVIFMSNMFDAYQYNKQIAAKYNSNPIKIFYFSALEYMLYPNAINNVEPKSLEVRPYNKKFLNLNRRWREHRPLLVLLLRYRNLLEKGFVSFGPCENHGDWKDIWDGLRVGAIGNTYLFNAINESTDIMNMPPLLLDTEDLHTNKAELESTTDVYYANSYFSLVSETTFYHRRQHQSSRFITEKTFKPIAMKHPFLLVTIPRSLEVLKFLGYKTFSPWIDESYDSELNDNQRLLKIIDEVERLSNLSDSEVETFVRETNDICQYNFDLLKSKKKFIYEMGETCTVV